MPSIVMFETLLDAHHVSLGPCMRGHVLASQADAADATPLSNHSARRLELSPAVG